MILGYTQQHVSRQIKITEANYNKIENGKSAPQLETLQAICEVLEIEWDEIKLMYLRAITSTQQLLRLAEWSFWKDDIEFGRAVTGKVFAVAKHTKQDHLIALGLFQIMFWDPERKRNKRLRKATAEYMRMIGRKRTAQMAENVVFDKDE